MAYPDGWEARGACTWDVSRVGINPLNGSDAFENPDGDGYDINHNGVIEENEAFVNWLEYHIRDDLFSGNMSLEGDDSQDNFKLICSEHFRLGRSRIQLWRWNTNRPNRC